jgi:hypothetical protein
MKLKSQVFTSQSVVKSEGMPTPLSNNIAFRSVGRHGDLKVKIGCQAVDAAGAHQVSADQLVCATNYCLFHGRDGPFFNAERLYLHLVQISSDKLDWRNTHCLSIQTNLIALRELISSSNNNARAAHF